MEKRKNIFVFFVSLAFSIFLIEIFFSKHTEKFSPLSSRFFQPFIGFGEFRSTGNNQAPESFGYHERNGVYIYDPKKAVRSVSERYEGTFEDLGDKNKNPDKSPLKVFVMGGSSALGDGYQKPENRFMPQIQEKLKDLFRVGHLQVFPAAIRAFNSTQERILLDLYVLPSKPKAIFFLHGINDANQWESMTRPGDPYTIGLEYSRQEMRSFRLWEFLGDWSYFFRWLYRKRAESTVIDGFNNMLNDPEKIERYVQGMANVYIDNVRWMARRCLQEKVHCFFLLQPTFLQRDKVLLPETYLEIRKSFSDGQNLNPFAVFFDFSEYFAERGDLFVDGVHMRDEGQILLAAEVVRRAAPLLRGVISENSGIK